MLFAGVIGQGLVIVGIGFTTVLFLALALSFAIGVLQTMVNVPIAVFVQTRVPGWICSGECSAPLWLFLPSLLRFRLPSLGGRGLGIFYLNWWDVPGFWRTDRASLRPRKSVLQRFERR